MSTPESNGSTDSIDLRGIEAPNPLLKMVAHLKKTEPGFERLPYHRQIERADLVCRTAQVIH